MIHRALVRSSCTVTCGKEKLYGRAQGGQVKWIGIVPGPEQPAASSERSGSMRRFTTVWVPLVKSLKAGEAVLARHQMKCLIGTSLQASPLSATWRFAGLPLS